MKPFQPPTKELAKRILGEVDFQDRLIGHRMRKRMGPVPVSLYSFGEVVGLLTEAFPQMDLDDLSMWVAEKIGDRELAWAIEEIGRKEMDDPEKLLHIRGLMAARLSQSRRVAGRR
jgi:hypothetical protein